jgi:hypothetical protein
LGCQTAVASLLAIPEAACLDPSGITSILAVGANTSLVSSIDAWAKSVCVESPCSNSTLSELTGVVAAGCQAELTSLGITSEDLTTQVQTYYPAVREALCDQKYDAYPLLVFLRRANSETSFPSTMTDTICLTELLTNVQKDNGTFTLSFAEQFIPKEFNAIVTQKNISALSQRTFCTDCNKEFYNIIRKTIESSANSDLDSKITAECGQSFVGAYWMILCGLWYIIRDR